MHDLLVTERRPELADGYRATFTVRQGGHAAGITSVIFDPRDPAGAEVGGTLLDPGVARRDGTRRQSRIFRLDRP